MTKQERTTYQSRPRNAKSDQDLVRIQSAHRKEIQVRASECGVSFPVPVPAREGQGQGDGVGDESQIRSRSGDRPR